MSILAVLRIVHIFFGAFLVGYSLFMVLILMPRLKRLGPAIQGPVMQALGPVLTPVIGISVIVIVGTGVAMTLILRQGNLSTLFTTGWGWAILIGLVLTVAASVVGFGFITPLGLRMERLTRSIGGRAPKPEEAQQLGQMSARMEFLERVSLVLIVIILLAMLLARYV